MRREGGGELGPGTRRVDDLAALRVEYPEGGGAPAVHDGDQPTVERREPSQAELPQRPAELLLARAQLLAVEVEVPPAAAVTRVQQAAVMGPVGLGDGLAGPAGHGTGVEQGAVGTDVGEDQFGAVPGHPRMVPGEPGGLPPVGRELRSGQEPVPFVGQFAQGAPVQGRGSVQRHGGQDTSYVAGPVAGELLQYAPHFVAFGPQQRLRPAQARPHRGRGRERARLPAGLVAVEPLVGEVHEHHQRAVVARERRRPGMSAVLDDPAPHVPRRGQQ